MFHDYDRWLPVLVSRMYKQSSLEDEYIRAWKDAIQKDPGQAEVFKRYMETQMHERALGSLYNILLISLLAGIGGRGLLYSLNRFRKSPIEEAAAELDRVDSTLSIPDSSAEPAKTVKRRSVSSRKSKAEVGSLLSDIKVASDDGLPKSFMHFSYFIPGALLATTLPFLGGYYMTDALIGKARAIREQAELDELKEEYNKAIANLFTQKEKSDKKKKNTVNSSVKTAQFDFGLQDAVDFISDIPWYYKIAAGILAMVPLYWATRRAMKRTESAALRRALITRSHLRSARSEPVLQFDIKKVKKPQSKGSVRDDGDRKK